MTDLFRRVEDVIRLDIRPMLHDHDGDIKLISIEDGVAKVRFLGACRGCPGAQMTINDIVSMRISAKVSEIKKVVLVDAISEDMLSLAKKLLAK
ncbi:MAG: NifU family protein [Acidaminobacteraceae bacterium]